mgnify:CR=1 FL=1
MQEVEKVGTGLRGEDCYGNVYEIGLPPQYLQNNPTSEDYEVYLHLKRQLNKIIENPTEDNGIILPVVRDENGQPYFYFNVHHKSKPKYKYRETVKVGDIEHIFEADTIERLNELKLNLENNYDTN